MNQELETSLTQKPKKSKYIYVILGITTCLLLIGILIYIFNPLKPSPLEVLSKMTENIENISSVTFDAKTEIEDLGNLEYRGEIDKTNLENIKMAGNIKATVSYFFISLLLDADVIIVDKETYIKINKSQPENDYVPLNKWIKSEEDYTHSRDIFSNEEKEEINMFILEKEMSSKRINGVRTYHYIVKINPEELKSFKDMIISEDYPLDKEEELIIDNLISWVEKIEIDLFIGQKDYLLYGLKIDELVDLKEILPTEEIEMVADMFKPFNLKFEIFFSNFNKLLNIEAPKDYIKEKDLYPLNYDFIISEAKNNWLKQDWQQQSDYAEEALSVAKTDTEKATAYFWLGVAENRQRNHEKAKEYQLKAIELDPEYAAAHASLANAYVHLGEVENSLIHSQKCIEYDPEYSWCYQALMNYYLITGDLENARINAKKATELNPDDKELENIYKELSR